MEQDALEATALQAAYMADWRQAIVINVRILKSNPNNLGALNRLAKAYMENGEYQKSVSTYQKVLKIDCYNSIAQKNIHRLKNLSNVKPSVANHHVTVVTFIEEPGVTKSVQLTNTAEPAILAQIDAGDLAELVVKRRQICVVSPDTNIHIGKLPEDLSIRLINLMKGGNQYQAWIKSIKEQQVNVFIKEIYRASKFQYILSFPDAGQAAYLAFTDPQEIYSDRPDTTSTDEQE